MRSCKSSSPVRRLPKHCCSQHSRFIVDSADKEALPVAKEELHILLEKPAMEGIPLLVLGNKSDLRGHLTVDELIDSLDLKRVTHREVSCYGISAKEETNLDAVLQWLIARSTK
jgi:ADP-ribosylation factor-like protein 8